MDERLQEAQETEQEHDPEQSGRTLEWRLHWNMNKNKLAIQ
jgi:hypothetical protein